jgi:endoglycosylceramidase
MKRKSSVAPKCAPVLRSFWVALLFPVLTGLGACSGQDDGQSGGSGEAVYPSLPVLYAARGNEAGLYDDEGRQVLLRGISMGSLGDYYQANANIPSNVPVQENDIPLMAELGANSIRLVLNWSAVEPERGSFSEEYLDRIHRIVQWAGRYGIYVILDMHQDGYTKFIATPPKETCFPGFTPTIGFDGAPAWATVTDGLPTCVLGGARDLSLAVAQAWQNFWLDRDGIRTEFVRMWERMAEEFSGYTNLAGYDLLNEPHPGFSIGITDVVLLGDFYGELIRAIREAEDRSPSGLHHILFVEPSALWSALGVSLLPLPTFTNDPNLVFAPHLYASVTNLALEDQFDFMKAGADCLGSTFWIGEWYAGDPQSFWRYAQMEDRYLVGGAFWHWRPACGDPQLLVQFEDREYQGELGSILRVGCPGDIELCLVRENARVLSRAYPRAAPGRLTSLISDPESRTLSLTGNTSSTGILDLWIPDWGGGRPRIQGRNIQYVEVVEVPGTQVGGFRAAVLVSSSYEVNVSLE